MKTKSVFIEDIGWHGRKNCFVDPDGERIERGFKLYPWEWMWNEEFGVHLMKDSIQFHRTDVENAIEQQGACCRSFGNCFPNIQTFCQLMIPPRLWVIVSSRLTKIKSRGQQRFLG